MRILIDMQGAQTESRYRGIGRYSMSLVEGIIRNAGDHEVFILLNQGLHDGKTLVLDKLGELLDADRFLTWNGPKPTKAIDGRNQWRCTTAEIIRESHIAGFEPDVVLITSLFEGFVDDAVTSIGIYAPHIPTVTILYDLIPFVQSEIYLAGNRDFSHFYQEKIAHLKRAAAWLSISEASAREGVELLGLPDNRVFNISTASDPIFTPRQVNAEEKLEFLGKLQIEKDFILYTGGSDPRKNLPRLIQAYGLLPIAKREEFQLVLAGRIQPDDVEHLVELASAMGVKSDRLVFTNYITDEDLALLYCLCTVFIFPSLHEGFGLPVLEAIACGAVVIASESTSIPEVLGIHDAMFDPNDVEAIKEKLQRVLSDKEFRKSLRNQESKRRALFSWDITAKRAISALEAIGQKNACVSATGQRPWNERKDRLERNHKETLFALSALHSSIGPTTDDLREVARCLTINECRMERFHRIFPLDAEVSWQIEGPFDTSYSLALVNREIGRALQKLGVKTHLESREGHGPFPPDPVFLSKNPDLALMASAQGKTPDVCSRFLYPPTVTEMQGRLNFLHGYCWEETGFPFNWVQSFNEELQGIFVASEHVRKILIDNGVHVPIAVTGLGVDHFKGVKVDRKYKTKGRRYKLLHISSCFPRKGIDSLLKAYGLAFSQHDDVSLIIKTFPNPHNRIHEWLKEARSQCPDYPDVHLIEEDLTENQLKALYKQCDVLVAPSRAEGFGLPMAEAMLSELPVITTAWSGQTDFCQKETAWLVDYEFSRATSHLDVFDSVWAEPVPEALATQMREVFLATPSERKIKIKAAKELIEKTFNWESVARRMLETAKAWSSLPKIKPDQTIGWVTTWNTRCGIATYSSHLLAGFPAPYRVFAPHFDTLTSLDEEFVERCWSIGEEDDLHALEVALTEAKIRTLIVQFNYGFFNLEAFSAFLERQVNLQRSIIVTMHSTSDPAHAPHKKLTTLVPALGRCKRILVHSVDDLNRLKSLGLVENVALFPHGILDFSAPRNHNKTSPSEFTIASYGFFLPHKGLLELIHALGILHQDGKRFRLKMVNAEYPAEISKALLNEAHGLIDRLGLKSYVSIHSDFLEDDKSLSLLADADLIVFPYQNTGESASGAVRYGIATGRPVAVTPLAIFSDVREVVFTINGENPSELARTIGLLVEKIMAEDPITKEKRAKMDLWRENHRYELISQRLFGMLEGISALD